MADDRTHPPSELKLARLRAAGVIPLSSHILSFGACLGFVIAASILARLAPELFNTWLEERLRQTPPGLPLGEQFTDAAVKFGRLSLAALAALSAAVLAAGLLQTRFLISFQALSPDLGRLAQLRLPGRQDFSAALRMLFSTAVVVIAGWLLLRYAVEEVRELAGRLLLAPHANQEAFIGEARTLLGDLLRWLLVISFFVGLFSYILAVIRFRAAHAMSRAELEAEYREQEPSADFRERRRQIQSEALSDESE